ncbi:hypothetical protein F5Y12DRAFT_650730 [Xylaria sp. FL1777]|nr:hypothetical protein F5Y12DRAFT_650730 [Xylaria sp. FL1777]
MESPRAARSVRSETAPGIMGSSTESTSTSGINTEDGDGYVAGSAYLLKWTDTEIAKTIVHSAAQIRSCVEEASNSTRQLLVLRGLSVDHGVALRETTDVDASFIDAHTGRRSYRPRRARVKAAWAHYDYPELVPQSAVSSSRQRKAASHDLVRDIPTYMVSATGDSIMLCRASIWLSEKAHILLLDREPWEGPKSEVSRGRYEAYSPGGVPDENGVSTITTQIAANGNMATLGDEIPSLETMLYDGLRDCCSGYDDDLLELLEERVLDKWHDFFEVLDIGPPVGSAETIALLSQALGSLERNLDASRRRHTMRQRSVDANPETRHLPDARTQPATTEWEALLSRLSRRAQLLSHLAPVMVSLKKPPARCSSMKTDTDAGFGVSSAGGHGEKYDYCKPRNTSNNSNDDSDNYTTITNPSTPDENQRALNRVAYLGGVLLPFSVVSGILAIEEPYGPGGSQFWIFWAVTVPLTLVTLGVIYADSIRKVHVWVEVAGSGKSGSDSDSDTDMDTGTGTVGLPGRPQPDVEQAMPRTAQRIAFAGNFVGGGDEDEVGDEGEGEGEGEDEDEDEDEEGRGEPDVMVEKRWKNAPAYGRMDVGADKDDDWARKKKMMKVKWRKEELGWAGACATMFQVYKLKKGVPPKHLRHSDTRGGLPRRAKTIN